MLVDLGESGRNLVGPGLAPLIKIWWKLQPGTPQKKKDPLMCSDEKPSNHALWRHVF